MILKSFAALCLVIASAEISSLAADEKKPGTAGEQAVATWTKTESRLANHYIQLLQKDPSYGKVLDLLWGLYRKNNQTALLLGYFQKASESEKPDAGIATLLYAHLLRKNGDIGKARDRYEKILKSNPEDLPAVKAMAEIADQQKQFATALIYYDRLTELIPVSDADGVPFRLRRAVLHWQEGQTAEAVAAWEDLLKDYPENLQLRKEIVSRLLEAGETATAIQVLGELAQSNKPTEKLNALLELNRLYEFINDFDHSVQTAHDGMNMLHFKDQQYGEFFSRLVSTYERFNRLDELESELRGAADRENPTEKDLYLLGDYYKLTANPLREEAAVSRLVEKLPEDVNYRLRLAEIQMANDRYTAAADTLDGVLKGQSEIPLRLVLMRARVAVTDENPAVAESILAKYHSAHRNDPDITKKIMAFARGSYLDGLVEKLLREGNAQGVVGSDGESAPIELARFLQERGRKEQAIQTLRAYVDSAGEATVEKARRLHQVATAFREIHFNDEAISAIDRALALFPDNVDYLITKADILVDEKKVSDAVATLELVWEKQSGLEKKSETDQRIFTLLRGYYTKDKVDPDAGLLKSGGIQTLSQYRRIAAAASRTNRVDDHSPPKEVMRFYLNIRDRANQTPTLENRYRAAWWALKLQDNRECYVQLTSAQREAGKPVIAIEKMLLDLAEKNERIALIAQHLETLAKIDPDNQDEYLQKRALVRFQMGYEDEAVRELKLLVAKPDASLSTLNALAKIYKRQGSTTKHIEVWRSAFRKANLYEKRSIIKQLSSELIESGKAEEALKVQLELIEQETDPVQRRKQLDTQITTGKANFLLDWLRAQYVALGQKKPFDRFFPEALARIELAAGNEKEAFASMKRAYYMSGQDSGLLDELSELASRLGDLKSAIYYRRQIISRSGGDTTIADWKSLIEMLEKDLRVGEADLLRKRLETKFGQDPDFLGELAQYYRENNHSRPAERVLEKLVALRGWDIHALLELGLLKSEGGRSAEADPLFEKIIQLTRDVEPPSGSGQSRWPVVRVPRPASGPSAGEQLREMAATVEDYPSSSARMGEVTNQERVADWLQKSHPEFSYLPRNAYFVRMRAIEESAAIHRTSVSGAANTAQWMSRWTKNGGVPLAEKLWAARYSLSRETLIQLLEQQQNSVTENPIDSIWRSYLFLLAGADEELIDWTKRSDPSVDRASVASMASFLLLKDRADREILYDQNVLRRFLGKVSIKGKTGVHFFSELRKEGKSDRAFLVGKILAESKLVESGDSYFMISQMARQSGRENEYRYWLDKAVQDMITDPGAGVPPNFYPALTEKLSQLESDFERRQLADHWRMQVEANRRIDPETRLEEIMLLKLAVGDTGAATKTLSDLVRRKASFIHPEKVIIGVSGSRNTNLRNWAMMNSLLARTAPRFRLTNQSESAAFVQAMGSGQQFFAGAEGSDGERDLFEIERLAWLLEWQDEPTRRRTVKNIYAGLSDPKSGMNLGRVLQELGFQKEAARSFLWETEKSDRGYAPFHGLFESCYESLDPEPALAVIRKLERGEIATPPGLTVDYLNEQHARFLFLVRDVEQLSKLGRPPTGGKGSPPITTTTHLPYQHGLIRAYRQSGSNEDLLQLLTGIRRREQLDKADLVLGADILREQGRFQEAMEWIQDMEFDGTHSLIERKAIVEMMQIQEESGLPNKEVLIRFARTSQDTQPATVTLQLIDAIRRSGASAEALGLARLLYRKTKNPGFRDQIALQILKTRLDSGIGWSRLSDDLEMFLDGLQTDEMEAPGNLVRMFTDRPPTGDVEKVKEFLRGIKGRSDCGWLTRLLAAYLDDTLPEEATEMAKGMSRKRFEVLLETLIAFGEVGKKTAADLVDSTELPGDLLFRGHPEMQIPFFGAIRDVARLKEVHAALIRESESATFQMSGLIPSFPTLTRRYRVPTLFAAAGYPDLAGSLFRKYKSGIIAVRWEHQAFLKEYVGYLIGQNQFLQAELLLGEIAQKSLRFDFRQWMTLYQKWGKLDEWEKRTAPYHLTSGQQELFSEWRRALAEGRKMVEYDPEWE